MFILDLKSKPSNINYNTEEFTSTAGQTTSAPVTLIGDQVLATNSAHNVSSDVQTNNNCPAGVDCSQDTQIGANASQSSISNTVLNVTVQELNSIEERCRTQGGLVVRTESDATYYPGGTADTRFDYNSECGHSILRSFSDDPALNSDTSGNLDASVYCDLDCGSGFQTTTNSSTGNLNQNVNHVSFTTTATTINTISSQQSEKSEGFSGGEIAGIVIGVLSAVGIIVYFVYIKYIKKTKNKISK